MKPEPSVDERLTPDQKRVLLVMQEIKAINPEHQLITGLAKLYTIHILNQLVDMEYVEQHGCAGGITVYTLKPR